MRRLVVLSVALVLVFAFSLWLVAPMFVAPAESALDECGKCGALLNLVPSGAARVVVIPHGGATLFELGRRLTPGKEITEVVPAPGLLAIGLGQGAVVAWQDASGRVGGAAVPSGARRMLVRVATLGRGGRLRWEGGSLVFGEAGSGPFDRAKELERLRDKRGHFFAIHDVPAGVSVGRLTDRALEIRTFPPDDGVADAKPGLARHPQDALISLSVSDVNVLVRPLEMFLPVRTDSWRDGGGQLILYDVDSSGLLPRLRGLLFVDGEADARAVVEGKFPRVEGATRDTERRVGSVHVFRRETLGIVVEAAAVDQGLAVTFDGDSMDRWLRGELVEDYVPAVWSFSGDPARIASAIDGFLSSPGRAVLSGSAKRSLKTLRAIVDPFRSALRVESRRLAGSDGRPVVESRVEW